jgi:GAF domain-containing protein/tRNA A-37 threonylcarbamoyl transferase component Bud32
MTSEAGDHTEEQGTVLLRNRYRIESLIEAGGMAEVYRARDEFLGRDVAVKIFKASATAELDFKRQEDEVNVLARLNHPNLVTLFDAAVDRTDADVPRIYYVMELVQGTDLKRRLDESTLVPRQVAQLGYGVALALEHVHAQGIVHRDVKPANILLAMDDDGSRLTAKLGDFGVASVGNAGPIADDEVVTGTVAYLSPEQARGEEVSAQTDIYSLGLVLLQCFTGRLAFPGPPQHSAMARLLDPPVIGQEVPEEWVPLLTAMTATEPGDRPDIHDVALALRQMFAAETGRHKAVEASPTTDETARLAAVRRYELLDTGPDEAFDRITALAARVLKTPVSIVSVVDTDRVWFKSHHGIDVSEITRDPGLCASAIQQNEAWIIEDARLDDRASANPLVAGEFGLQFYAGVPLRTSDGHNLGTLCVLDFEPRVMSADDIVTLQDLANMVMRELELRFEARTAAVAAAELDDDLETLTSGPSLNPDGTIVTNRPTSTIDGLLSTGPSLMNLGVHPVADRPRTGPIELDAATAH